MDMASGKILSFFSLLLYVLVTLIPDWHSPNLILTPHLIAFPFVLWWQGGLILMVVLFLLRLYPQERNFYLFGQGIDRWILGAIILVIVNCLFAEFKQQAIWQAGIFFSFTAIAYGIWQHLKITDRPIGLLKLQALIQVAYIIDSLTLWIINRVIPYLKHLKNLSNEGITHNFDLHQIANDLPSGDTNYVAGYLILALPLLLALSLVEKGWWRKIGILGFILGIIDLYTTCSWAGFVGLCAITLAFLSFFKRFTAINIFASTVPLLFIVLSNSYIRSVLSALIRGENHLEFIFRDITNATGISIIKSNWLLGSGIGSIPLVYQQYRPEWAFNQGEMDFQLHSLPLQIFSELGIGGIFILLWGGILLLQLILRSPKQHPIYHKCLTLGIIGYSVLSVLDYQLDVITTSITLVIYLVVLLYNYEPKVEIFPPKYRKLSTLIGWFLLFAGLIWVTPINFAWYLSSQGFDYLRDFQTNNTETQNSAFANFQAKLNRALEFAPWETYYSNQIAWNLGSKSLLQADQNSAQEEQKLALNFFQKSIDRNPYQEFSYHQSAWLLLTMGDGEKAQPMFEKALALLPHKASLHFGLGLSLIRQGKNELGIKSIVEECFYHPSFITSPLWYSQQLQGLYPIVMTELAKLYQAKKQDLNLAVLNWWLGKPNAVKELRSVKQPVTDLLADTIEDKRENLQTIVDQPITPRDMVISAWYNPSKRQEKLRKAWINSTGIVEETAIQSVVNALTVRMNNVNSFDEFLRSPLPLFTPLNLKEPNQRVGFGIMSRHIDGPDPYDLFVIERNAIFAHFWSDLFPSPGIDKGNDQ
jgi:tetratricopeptide (TPR) repeat protein